MKRQHQYTRFDEGQTQMHDERTLDNEDQAERETQILDGLRWADCLLSSFGLRPHQIDAASLVTLRTLEWVNPETPVREVIDILRTVDPSFVLRKVS